MTRVEEPIPQVVEEVKPDEEEDVDAHPDHLHTQPGPLLIISFFCIEVARVWTLTVMFFLFVIFGVLRTKCVQTSAALCGFKKKMRFLKAGYKELTSMKDVSPWLIIQLPMLSASPRPAAAASLHPSARPLLFISCPDSSLLSGAQVMKHKETQQAASATASMRKFKREGFPPGAE